MAITAANRFTGSSGVNGPYTTTSLTPVANRLYLFSVQGRISTGSVQPVCSSVTGAGLTWVQVNFSDMDNAGTDRQSVYTFRSMGTGSAGALTVTFSGQTLQRACWVLDEFDGVDTSGTNGSGAIVQSVKVDDGGSSATSAVATLAALADAANNASYSICGHQVQEAINHDSGDSYTELSDQAPLGVTSMATQVKIPGTTTPDWTWATGGRSGAISIEIKAAAAATAGYVPRRDPHRGLYMR